jgi:DNA-binding transcriptional regulator YdaS (Cro superfamily)
MHGSAFSKKIRYSLENVSKKGHVTKCSPKKHAMQSKPDYLDQLIDRASEKAGSDYRLAQMLEVGRSTVSQWRHGKKTCPAGDVALMADIAGLVAEDWTNRAVIAAYAGTSKGEKIARALGKALVATGAVIVTSGVNAGQIGSDIGAYLIRCIVLLSRKRALVIR